MVDRIQAMQIALDYLFEDTDEGSRPMAEDYLSRFPDDFNIWLEQESVGNFDVRGHDLWCITHRIATTIDTTTHLTVLFVDSDTGEVWELGEPRPPAFSIPC